MELTDLTPIRLRDLYNEYWCLMQSAQFDLHAAMREGNDELAAKYRQEIKTYRQKADDVVAELERRKT